MKYSKNEVLQFVNEEDVKFIRLAFCDVFGKQKNISVMPDELPRAFEYGIAIDASSIDGFGDETRSDLLLHPDPETLMTLPWRPEHGKERSGKEGKGYGLRPQRMQASVFSSAPSRNSICSTLTKTAMRQTCLTIRRAIWT